MSTGLPIAEQKTEPVLRRVCLVQPPVGGIQEDITPPLGLLLLGAILKREGRVPSVLDLNLIQKIQGFDPDRSLRGQFAAHLPKKGEVDVFGVTAWSYNFDVAMELVEEIRKRHKQAVIVLGGPHVTFVDEDVLRAFPGSVDYVIRDEGDVTFPQLLTALDAGAPEEALAGIPGLTWRRGDEVVRNPGGSVVEDLDELPFPAYHLIDVQQYLACSPVLVLEAGRGCPYNCNFCSTSNMFQRKYRVKSPGRLLDEVEWLMEHSGSNRFELLHDNLVASKKYVVSLCQEIRRRNIDLSWSCTSRTDNITEAIAQEMFLAGCDQIFFGVESLDGERQKWTGKRLEPEKILAAIELTARQHIHPQAGIIVGFPDESDEEFDLTLATALRWVTDPRIKAEVSTGLLRYYPGADLYAQADQLHADPLAAADTAAVPGYKVREAWKKLPRLFPLQSIHTGPDETRRNMLTVKFIRTILRACPLTLRATSNSGIGLRALFDRMMASRRFESLRARGRDPLLLWNETLLALGQELEAEARPELIELLDWEAPFWRTQAVSPPLQRLEHVVHEKRFDQDELLAFARGERSELPSQAQGLKILGVRAGQEVGVWVTADPARVLQTFQQSLAKLAR